MDDGRIRIVKVVNAGQGRHHETIEYFIWTGIFSCLSTSEVKLFAIISIDITGSPILTPPAPNT